MSQLKKILNKNLNREPDQRAVNELIAFISNNPTVTQEDLLRKSMEMGYNPRSLIDQALGSVKLDKSGASLSKDMPDILNEIYQNDPTPGKRYIIDPNDIESNEAKRVRGYFDKDSFGMAVASPLDKKGDRYLPDFQAIIDPKSDKQKLDAIGNAGHELKHNEDMLIRPGNALQTSGKVYQKGHHAQGIYEPDELIKEVRDLPQDNKIAEQIKKHAPDAKVHSWKKLRSLLPIVGPALAVGGGLLSGDASAAVGDALLPGGIEELQEPNDEQIKQMQKEQFKQQKMNKLQKLIKGKKND